MHRTLQFIEQALLNPREIAAFMPTSLCAAHAICRFVRWKSTHTLCEQGAGNGAVTEQLWKYMLKKRRGDGQIVAIEPDPVLVHELQKRLRDPRMFVIHGKAEETREILAHLGILTIDCLITGIPFSQMSCDTTRQIIETSEELLRPGGQCIAYQITDVVTPHLRRCFGTIEASTEFLNLPPLTIYRCTKENI